MSGIRTTVLLHKDWHTDHSFMRQRLALRSLHYETKTGTYASTYLFVCIMAYRSIYRKITGKYLVHCNMGISQSTTIIIRYLQIMHNMTYRETMKYIKTRRPFVKPNSLFKRILIKQDI